MGTRREDTWQWLSAIFYVRNRTGRLNPVQNAAHGTRLLVPPANRHKHEHSTESQSTSPCGKGSWSSHMGQCMDSSDHLASGTNLERWTDHELIHQITRLLVHILKDELIWATPSPTGEACLNSAVADKFLEKSWGCCVNDPLPRFTWWDNLKACKSSQPQTSNLVPAKSLRFRLCKRKLAVAAQRLWIVYLWRFWRHWCC